MVQTKKGKIVDEIDAICALYSIPINKKRTRRIAKTLLPVVEEMALLTRLEIPREADPKSYFTFLSKFGENDDD